MMNSANCSAFFLKSVAVCGSLTQILQHCVCKCPFLGIKGMKYGLTPFPPVTTFVACSLICSLYCKHYGPRSDCSFRAIWSGFIVFASMIKSSWKCTWIFSADVKCKQHFTGKKYWWDQCSFCCVSTASTGNKQPVISKSYLPCKQSNGKHAGKIHNLK